MSKDHQYFQKGFSLTEIMVAMGIMAVVLLGGMKAYEHFGKETKKEVKKMGELQEFNQLTRDLLKFSEGAGISTAFLNLPVKVKNCEEDGPCVRKLQGEKFVTAEGSELPSALASEECVQFFVDAKARPEGKLAYPDKPQLKDLVFEFAKLDITPDPMIELMTTWTLKNEKSPPMLMMKLREGGVVFNQLKKGAQISKVGNPGVTHAFFHSNTHPKTVKALLGYPFLIYSSIYNAHYTIQYAADIISCKEKRAECVNLLKKINAGSLVDDDEDLSDTFGVPFPAEVFAIEMRPIDYSSKFFAAIREGQKLPASCQVKWGDNVQPAEGLFFPTEVFSVASNDDPDGDLPSSTSNPLNVLHLNHYYTGAQRVPPEVSKLIVALPIDIYTYKVEKAQVGESLNLVSELWHATEVKKRTKIHNLRGPFIIARKLGTAEIGIWYNPMAQKKGAEK